MLLTMLLLAADPDALIAQARVLTAAERPCVTDPDSTDVTVCGMRHADRMRVPFVVHDPGDPRYEGVPAERERLLHRTTPIQELSPFLVGGGAAGVTATVGLGSGKVGVVGERPLAP